MNATDATARKPRTVHLPRKPPGRIPYGHRANGEYLEPNPYQQSVLRLMGKLRRQGHSHETIAYALDVEGHPPPSASSDTWRASTVHRILTRAQETTGC